MQQSTQQEIRDWYQGQEYAAAYVERRFTSELMRLLHERQVAAVQRVFDREAPSASLEIAPGPGRLTRELSPSGRLICLEYNAGMIAEGKASCRNGADWMQGDAFDLPFGSQFQFVFSFRFVRHFKRPDRDRLYQQIYGALKPGGTFVLDAVNAQVSGPLRQAAPESYPIYDKLYISADELTQELDNAGFQVVHREPVQRWFAMQYRAQVLLGPRNKWLCWQVIRTLERMRRGPALEWIVTCRRV